VLAVAAGVLLAGCGGGSGSSPSSVITCSTIPNPASTLLYLNNTVCPQALTVPIGTRVTVINNDSRAHEFESDPHPEHTDCPELNQVGFLEPGQQRDSGNLNITRQCGFHDHTNPSSRALQGTITIR
jgi:hypothetical protein